jgi:hypothetical protein
LNGLNGASAPADRSDQSERLNVFLNLSGFPNNCISFRMIYIHSRLADAQNFPSDVIRRPSPHAPNWYAHCVCASRLQQNPATENKCAYCNSLASWR